MSRTLIVMSHIRPEFWIMLPKQKTYTILNSLHTVCHRRRRFDFLNIAPFCQSQQSCNQSSTPSPFRFRISNHRSRKYQYHLSSPARLCYIGSTARPYTFLWIFWPSINEDIRSTDTKFWSRFLNSNCSVHRNLVHFTLSSPYVTNPRPRSNREVEDWRIRTARRKIYFL